MTRSQCFEILKDTTHPKYKELHHIFYTNRNKCRKYYTDLGTYKSGMVLHHKIFNCDNYEDWKIDEIEPMDKREHSRLHMVIYKQGLGSEASNIKAHVENCILGTMGRRVFKFLSEKEKPGKIFHFYVHLRQVNLVVGIEDYMETID